MKKAPVRTFASIALSITLAFGLVPSPAFAQGASTNADGRAAQVSTQGEGQDLEATVRSLLEAGDYVEGEAIVCSLTNADAPDALTTQSGGAADLLAGAEALSTVTARQYCEATRDGVSAPGADDVLATQSADEPVAVSLVRADDMTTEALLRALLADSRVLSAEPNYVMGFDEAAEAPRAQGASGFDAPAVSAPDATGVSPGQLAAAATTHLRSADEASGDLSPQATAKRVEPAGAATDLSGYQWFSAGVEAALPQYLDGANPGLRSPHWNEAGETNADGVVVIMDSGVDYTHPDLKDVMYRFTPELQEQLGCGEFGYAPAREDKTDPMDGLHHGTHCAGLVAAQWNGFGVSGIASGVEVCAVSVSQSLTDSQFGYDAIIKGYDFMIRAAKAGVDIRAVNRSLSTSPANNANDVMIQAAGELGIVTCIASGNDSFDLDVTAHDPALNQQSPYVMRVNASKMADDAAWFSNYGANTTDVFAPGTATLSTVPSNDPAQSTYIPAADARPLYLKTTFGDALPDVTMQIGATVSGISRGELGVDGDGDSMRMAISAENLGSPAFFIDVPVGTRADTALQDFSIATYGSGLAQRFSVLGIQLEDGTFTSEHIEPGYPVRNTSNDSPYGWSFASLHVADYSALGQGFARVTDSRGNTCVRLRLSTRFDMRNAPAGEKMDFDLYIDQIAVGAAGNAAFLPYRYESGTSMATPCVTACVAIVSSTMEGVAPDVRAANTVRKLKGAVRQADGYKGLCKQNGQIDLSLIEGASALVPVLESVRVVGDMLVVEGANFGEGGTVQVDGAEATVTAYSDAQVRASWLADIASGLHTVTVTTAAGASSQRAFILEVPSSFAHSAALFERDLVVPALRADGAGVMGTPTSMVATADGTLYAAAVNGDDRLYPAMDHLMRSTDQGASWGAIELPRELKEVRLASGGGKVFVLGATPTDQLGLVSEWHLYALDVSSGAFEHLGTYDATGEDVNTSGQIAYARGHLYFIYNEPSMDNSLPSRMNIRRFSRDYQKLGYSYSFRHRYKSAGCTDGPKVAVVGDSIYVAGFASVLPNDSAVGTYCGLERVDVEADGTFTFTDLSKPLEALAKGADAANICVAANDAGVFVVGEGLEALLPADAPSTDTFFMKRGGNRFESLGKTASRAPLEKPVAACAGGWLCVYSDSKYEATPQFGRATELPAAERPLAQGESVVVDSYAYTVTSASTASVRLSPAGKKSLTKATIPGKVELGGTTFSVTAVEAEGFAGAKKLARVKVRANVRTIGAGAFSNCPKLVRMTGGASVVSIGAGAFAGCAKLKAFTSPSTALKKIGNGAFDGCKKLRMLTIAKTAKLTEAGVKSSLAGSSVNVVKVKKSQRAIYRAYFTKKNCGRAVTVK